MIRTQKYYEGLAICLEIVNVALKKRLIFDTLGIIAQIMLDKSHQEKVEMEKFIHETLFLPRHLIASHMAVQNQYRGHVDAALGMWLELGHFAEAQEIFMEHLAPLYFGSPSSLKTLTIQKIACDLRRSGLDSIGQPPAGFRKSGQRRYVDFILLKLQSAGSSSPLQGRCSLLLETLRLLDDFEECAQASQKDQGHNDLNPHWADVLKQITPNAAHSIKSLQSTDPTENNKPQNLIDPAK